MYNQEDLCKLCKQEVLPSQPCVTIMEKTKVLDYKTASYYHITNKECSGTIPCDREVAMDALDLERSIYSQIEKEELRTILRSAMFADDEKESIGSKDVVSISSNDEDDGESSSDEGNNNGS